MRGERIVVDASVLAAAFFEEEATLVARKFMLEHEDLIGPRLLATEMASIAAKKVWKALAPLEVARRAVHETPKLVRLTDSASFASDAFDLAAEHRMSAYDATYLALARQSDAVLATLDAKLVTIATTAGLRDRISMLSRD